ncbi:hypothetical protein C4K04_0237 [Pseudomonas chlororaphis]|uniref:Uncharacterized protein n=1 Tax=Pseudomonas chlororaphis TaxID=587753 RepID=A0A3G7TGF5_9PSED|nr:hypothetical protein C4K04_0237 [Pseudomonas chlororaphis]
MRVFAVAGRSDKRILRMLFMHDLHGAKVIPVAAAEGCDKAAGLQRS